MAHLYHLFEGAVEAHARFTTIDAAPAWLTRAQLVARDQQPNVQSAHNEKEPTPNE
ncbi:hypothetical protein OG604_24855 [Streptomyces sp. NBC_01231]|nr:hypothetical protein OG604_24855 [Streptomyces sp. NBC_01231]